MSGGPAALTERGRAALVCGLAALVYGRLFGTVEIALLGAALAGAALLARVWVGLAGGPHVAVRSLPAVAAAGERVRVGIELRPLEGARPGRAVFEEDGAEDVAVLRPVTAGGLRVLRGSYALGPLERGVRELGAGRLVREDPFGLARRVDATRGSTSLTVLAPRIELAEGALGGAGEAAFTRRKLRSGGHELHGVREHQPGESLRGVHWPATAHHGRLMVKELDDPAGDELAVVLDARASGVVGAGSDTTFELAVAAAGSLVERAFADARRVRLVIAGDGEPVSASERTAVRKLLARARPLGERPLSELLPRLAAERIEVVTSRPGALVGTGRPRQLDVIAIDPSSFDASVPRDAGALTALRAAGMRVIELRRPEPVTPAVRARSPRALALRAALYAAAAAYGLLHARDLQIPALSSAVLAALAALAVAPALVALRLGRRLGLLALVPAALMAALLAAPPASLAGRLADAPGSWAQVVLPFAREEHPELRTLVLVALFVWLSALAWIWLVRPRPLAAGLLAILPFAVSATVYQLPQHPLRALVAGALVFAFLRTGRPAGGPPVHAAALAALALAFGAGYAAVPAASSPAVLPWTTWSFSHVAEQADVDAVWDMRYQPLVYPSKPIEVMRVRATRPSYWRAVVLADFDGLRFARAPQAIVARRARGGAVAMPHAPAGGRVRAAVQVEALDDTFLVAPGQPVSYALPAGAGPVELAADATAELRIAPAAGTRYVAVGSRPDPAPKALRSLPAAYPEPIEASGLRFAGESIPPFGAAGRERALAALFRRHRADPLWSAWQRAYAEARTVTRGAATPYQAVVALEAWLRTSRAYDEHAGLGFAPDALARWAASGTAGYCQMFSATLAALARLSGVPARVAEGFTTGDLRGGTYHVTDRDAHAWVEAWFPGFGWLPFDATPGRALPERASSSSAAFDGPAAQAAPTAGGGTTGLPSLQLPLGRLRAVGAAAAPAPRGTWWEGGAAVLLAVLAAASAAALLAKRALLRAGRPADPALAARERVRAFTADQGLELAPALTPRELGRAIERGFGVPAGGFAAALERAAYAPGARGDAALAAETAGLLAALRRSLGRTRRLRGALSLSGVRGRAR